jgi:hypothetical protein
MINLSSMPIPTDLPTSLADLLSLVADPVASKQRLTEMQKAAADLRSAVETSRAEQETFSAAKREHEASLKEDSDQASAKIAENQAAFDAECSSRKATLDQRDEALAQLEMKAKADADAAAKAKEDYEHRLALIKAATG